MPLSIPLLTDGYKLTHHAQYPAGTESVYSYFESRVGATYSDTTFFGLQYILKRFFTGAVVREDDIAAAKAFTAAYFHHDGYFNEAMWRHIVRNHGGRLPVRIRAVPEGMAVPASNVLVTVENTDPACFALTNHLETVLSHVWYPCTVATLSRKMKSVVERFLLETADPDALAALPLMVHDFGYRGVESVDAAGIGGAAHLVNFQGSDTVAGIQLAMQYYNEPEVVGSAVPATEHSVMTALGREGEREMFEHVLSQYPTGPLSIVSDSYDIFAAVRDIVCSPSFREKVLARDGVLVIRPDSGDPVTTLLRLLGILADGYGAQENSKGFRLLHPKVRLLWGDGLDYDGIYNILNALRNAGWSAANMASFGCGGGLLQRLDRDVQRFAFKCSAQKRNGVWHDIFKNPLDTTKASKKGRLALVHDAAGHIRTIREDQLPREADNLLEPVFENGELCAT
ncbi:MAG: nicotinate phosphoribosyltransferase [Planctomycetaceae bacterium]|nr:nicotinate phosphoribosyltransferase [Planctomycetaceae bacterium]